MQLDTPFKILKTDVDSSALVNTCNAFTDSQWTAWGFRQATFEAHRSTDTIPFVWSNNSITPHAPQFTNQAHPVWLEIEPHVRWLENLFGGAVSKVMLAKLLPHKSVERHTDMGELLPRIHRCHLPIKTNINVSFVIDETPFYFECGTWYELDNTRQHSVVNKSDEARIHLIVDILPHGVGAV